MLWKDKVLKTNYYILVAMTDIRGQPKQLIYNIRDSNGHHCEAYM
jgi:hypothetical protein